MASTALKVLGALFLLINYKSLPTAYYWRFYYRVIKLLVIPSIKTKLGLKPQLGPKPCKKGENSDLAVFQPTVLSTYNSILECDMYLHKSNSCYFEELDIARTETMCTIFQKLFLHYQEKTGTFPYVPVGAIQATFKKEIKPLGKYKIITRVLSWDDKWVFVISKFVLPGQNNRTSCISITKYVLKNGRKTITPIEALKICGLYNEAAEKVSQANHRIVKEFVDTGSVQDFDLFIPEATYSS